MLDHQRRRREVILADAHWLPIRTNCVRSIFFLTVLEFLDEPAHALSEANRVVSQLTTEGNLVIMALNGLSLLSLQRRLHNLVNRDLYQWVSYWTARHILHLLKKTQWQIRLWRSACFLPPWGIKWLPKKELLDDLLDLKEEYKISDNELIRVTYQKPIKIKYKNVDCEVLPYTFEDALVFSNQSNDS